MTFLGRMLGYMVQTLHSWTVTLTVAGPFCAILVRLHWAFHYPHLSRSWMGKWHLVTFPNSVLITSSDAKEVDISAGSAGFSSSLHLRSPSVRHSERILGSSPAAPAPNPCGNVPGLWFVKVGADASKILEVEFVVEPEFAATWDFQHRPSSTSAAQGNPTKSKLSVVLLCLPTAADSTLYSSLIPTNPTPERMATAIAGLETAWPRDGTLLLDMNKDRIHGKTWLPYDIDPTLPLDVTYCIRPGSNVIRFIQLTSMEERTFILYASRREPDSDMFDTAPTPSDNPMFNFAASVTVAQFL
ncbi:hypothetical protein B0H13DRAFT_2319878 [Mycena leptocephala]|nr:hypothetical protein B0H13DRAFT_2319878 [Mycena leptocephala]